MTVPQLAVMGLLLVIVTTQYRHTQGIKKLMSTITDLAKEELTLLATIQTGVTALEAQIAAFNPGALSTEDQAAIDAVKASITKLAASLPAPVVPAAPGAPVEPTAPSAA